MSETSNFLYFMIITLCLFHLILSCNLFSYNKITAVRKVKYKHSLKANIRISQSHDVSVCTEWSTTAQRQCCLTVGQLTSMWTYFKKILLQINL